MPQPLSQMALWKLEITEICEGKHVKFLIVGLTIYSGIQRTSMFIFLVQIKNLLCLPDSGAYTVVRSDRKNEK